jgi:homoserine kinase
MIKAFAPATVSNVSCGFDILGFPIEGTGDTVEVEFSEQPGIIIEKITGADNLSTEPSKNVCGVIAIEMLQRLNSVKGLKIRLTKGITPGSGIGSSAASSAATAFAINRLFNSPFSLSELVQFSMIGEKLASGSAHADNVAPALYGGFVIVRSYEPLDIIKIPVPDQLYCAVVHPKIELLTEYSRKILKKQVDLKTAVKQWGNVAGLIAGLYSRDYNLIGRSLVDYVAEPVRSLLIPGFDTFVQAAKDAGALGAGISGSGPSIFSLNEGKETAERVGKAFSDTAKSFDIPHDVYVSAVSPTGCIEIK